MQEVVFVQQNLNSECIIKCSDKVKSIKVQFNDTRVDNIIIELKEE